MKQAKTTLLVSAVTLVALANQTAAEEASTIVEALQSADVKLHLRLRYEDVDQVGAEGASAATLKTRLTYNSGSYQGFGLTVEMDDTRALGSVDYSDGVTNRGTAVIVDPETTELNQAYVSYNNWGSTFKLGRQRILLDNQRFVGGVGWRQDEQTYDAISVSTQPIEGLSVFYGHVTQVNRIFAETQDHSHSTHLVNANYATDWGTLVGYAYLIDNETEINLSSDTFGLRWQGKAGSFINYNIEYATQSNAADSTLSYSADYMLAELIGTVPLGERNLRLTAGYEVLGSDEGETAFSTPLATLHAFQGWTDQFLGTPSSGIVDTYLSAHTQLGKMNLTLVYHDFKADQGDTDYGSEIGFVAGAKVGPVGLTFKYADYTANDHSSDIRKVWLMAAATF